MCLSFPGKIVAIEGDFACVDYGQNGVRRNINVSLIDARIGTYVIVQGGFAIKAMTKKEAQEALEAWEMIREELEAMPRGGAVF